jgi:rubredoxin
MPKPFIEMDPELCAKAIEGYDNVLEGEQKKLDSFYRQFTCPQCKGDALQKEFVSKHAFADPDILVARAVLRCQFCKLLFDPHSGLIIERGDQAVVPVDIPLYGPKT